MEQASSGERQEQRTDGDPDRFLPGAAPHEDVPDGDQGHRDQRFCLSEHGAGAAADHLPEDAGQPEEHAETDENTDDEQDETPHVVGLTAQVGAQELPGLTEGARSRRG